MNNAGPIGQLTARLAAGGLLLLDGATGTELQRRGARMHSEAWCATATLTDPEILLGVHRDYILAGADIITTNTFSTNRSMLEPAGLGDRLSEINTGRRAAGPQGAGTGGGFATGRGGRFDVPSGAGGGRAGFPRSGGRAGQAETQPPIFGRSPISWRNPGVDLILMEMMSDPDLALPAIAAAKATGLPVWVGLSARMEEDGRLVAYHRREMSFAEAAEAIVAAGGSVFGIMHSHTQAIAPGLEIIRRLLGRSAHGLSGQRHFLMPEWIFTDIIPPADLLAIGRGWRDDYGVNILGGCCGLGVEHIQALAALK